MKSGRQSSTKMRVGGCSVINLVGRNSRRYGAAVSLAEVLPPLMRLAGERSVNGEVWQKTAH